MPGRWIAIGDIHGCATALQALIAEIAPQPDDTIVPLGDVIDRGPDSRAVIEQLLLLRDRCTLKPVMGNHEEMFLSVLRGDSSPQRWVQFGGAATLDSYGFYGDLSVIPREHVEFLESFSDVVENDDYFFVHANYDARRPLDEQDSRTLRWVSLESSMPPPHMSGKVAVVGHSADPSGEMLSLRHLKCLDTYCYGGQWLSALDVNTGRLWQANDLGVLRS